MARVLEKMLLEEIVEDIVSVGYLRTKDIQSLVVKQGSCNHKILQSSEVKHLSFLQLSSCSRNHSSEDFQLFFSETKLFFFFNWVPHTQTLFVLHNFVPYLSTYKQSRAPRCNKNHEFFFASLSGDFHVSACINKQAT